MSAIADLLQADPGRAAHEAARRWFVLALGAMAVSALLAVVLVLSRTPLIQDYFGLRMVFHQALVLHVDFSVLVWLLSFGAALWSLVPQRAAPLWDGLGLGLAAAGALLMAVSPLTGEARPVMNNYIPVLESSLFFTGLIGFLAGVAMAALRMLIQPAQAAYDAVAHALRAAGFAYLAALAVLAHHALVLPGAGAFSFEALFWGGGHLLQFVYALLLIAVWLLLAAMPLSAPAQLRRLLWLALLPVMAGAALAGWLHPQEAGSRQAFTLLMQLGMPLTLLPMAWLAMTRRAVTPDGALPFSVALVVFGMLVGATITGNTVTVTAHYHATNAAITIAFMGLAYRLLPLFGRAVPPLGSSRWQLRIYAGGMGLYVTGMAFSGWLGVPRKTAGAVAGAGQNLAMAAMGAGGLVAVGATLLFLIIVLRALRRCNPSSPTETGISPTS